METEAEEGDVFMLSLRKKGADIGHSSSPGLEGFCWWEQISCKIDEIKNAKKAQLSGYYWNEYLWNFNIRVGNSYRILNKL